MIGCMSTCAYTLQNKNFILLELLEFEEMTSHTLESSGYTICVYLHLLFCEAKQRGPRAIGAQVVHQFHNQGKSGRKSRILFRFETEKPCISGNSLRIS